ncbi:aspartyl/asparaginyl beta-hydroxylase domain-containing protein [Zestomonas thermotolerans]|uniref:aspartyl/asparaginyl beta-hydroxylase domain-containing protein n=1 Tax=Zestomonas thermotolerans TaxID=157784 RepID=UPI0023EFF5AA|nr:aspartyl/asparaginyl beta-hydroxylase domain-containing protein [Pseudomonas thermotolerans]MBO2509818.1 aspartyl beta-hydroxylase [Gammaproteobacteria bacterium]
MSVPLLFKAGLPCLFLLSVLFVHFRGRARLPLLRQMFNYSALFTPYNSLMYLFSSTPARPYLERRDFPELDLLRDNWQVIREEALSLFDEGYIRAALGDNEAGFGSFFKKGWKRFYLTWYDGPLPSARQLCPRTVALLEQVPSVRGAMFTLLPGGSHLNPHRDPFAGSLRYHLGLATPNSDACRIYVDGQPYAWRDGEDVMFDETYVHWVKNETDTTRIILFCDVERPLPTPLRQLNRWVSGVLGRATAPQNVEGERVGAINRAYGLFKRIGDRLGSQVRRFKRRFPRAYRVLKPVLAILLLVLLYRWIAT